MISKYLRRGTLGQFLRTEQLARNSTLSILQSIVGISTYFVVMRYVVQTTGLQGIGLWSLTMGLVALVRVLDLTGASGLARMVATEPDNPIKQAAYIDTLTSVIFIVYCAACLAAFQPLDLYLRSTIEDPKLTSSTILLAWAMTALPINVIGIAQLSALDGLGRADIRSIINIASFVCYGIIATIFVPSYGIAGLAFSQFSQYIVALIVARFYLVKFIPPLNYLPTQFSRAAARSCLHYGFRLQAASIPMAIFEPITRIFLGRWVGLDILGIYDLSSKLAVQTRALIQSGMNPMVPEFATQFKLDPSLAVELHSQASQKSIRYVALAFSFLLLASPIFSLLLFSKLVPEFLFSMAVLSLGWGTASFGLMTQLFARATGMLRWSITGQWTTLGVGLFSIYVFAKSLDGVFVCVSIALAVLFGHTLGFIGEVRELRLRPFGSLGAQWKNILVMASFCSITATLAVIYCLTL